MTIQEWMEILLGSSGLLVALILALVGVIRGWWVPGRTYQEAIVERDQWMRIAMKGVSTTSEAVRVMEPPRETSNKR